MRRKIALSVSIFLFLSMFFIPVNSLSIANNVKELDSLVIESKVDYQTYMENNSLKDYTGDAISFNLSKFAYEEATVKTENEYNGKNNVILWSDGKGKVSWNIEVPESAMYNLCVEFLPLAKGSEIEIGLLIDGESPFEDAKSLYFSREWMDATEEPRVDNMGNEIAPEQIETGEYVTRLATDVTGVAVEPYRFALSAGTHNITFCGNGYALAISSIKLIAPEKTEKYDIVSKKNKIENSIDIEPIVIQAEKAKVKSANVLISKSSNADAGLTPVDHYLTKVNYIGGEYWNLAGQIITWEFEVKKAGYYKFGTRYKQNFTINSDSCRWLKIDGKTPFEEAKKLNFPYGNKWDYYELGKDEDTPYYIWLDKGLHTVSLEVTLGDYADIYNRINTEIKRLGDMYLKIIMITGQTVDVNQDYELFRQIPDFVDTLDSISNNLKGIVEDLKKISDDDGNQYIADMNNMCRIIDKMLDAKYIAHIYLNDYYSAYSALSAGVTEMRKQALAIDEIRFAAAGSDFEWNKPNFFEKLWFSIKQLISSYVNDYSIDTANDSKDVSLTLWVNMGLDQTKAMNAIIQDSFVEEHNIDVELKIVGASLIEGLLSGNFPDVQLGLSRTAPVNYGIRGTLVNLAEFDDCDEVLNRFMDGAETPYRYKDALYALPDGQSFFCMFYRTDVFEQLGLEPPKTWDDFLDCATVIQRYNMDVYLPYTQLASSTAADGGIGSLNLYPTLLMQSGLDLYNQKHNATLIDETEQIQIFKTFTDFYSKYGYMKEADFFNRFRNGSMPLGIAGYTTYTTIYTSAPEIEGRWTIANVPATSGGTDYVAGSGTGCGIVKASKHHKEAWEFLKWWTSADTIVRYSNNIESIVGMLGRVAPANVEAFQNLNWRPEDLEKLMKQWESVKEVPEVPGSYYLARSVDQAFWSVLNDGRKPKDVLKKWANIANEEIERKIKEYS